MKKNTLTIRGLDDKVVENLKARARTRRHSLEAELREILSQASLAFMRMNVPSE